MKNTAVGHTNYWMHVWMRRGWVARLLWPLSLLFYLIVMLRRYGYRRRWLTSVRLPVPVIVVGNIFLGGTGKTPTVIWLVEVLRKAGFCPGVISRGYGTSGLKPMEVSAASASSEIGDEPLLIAQNTSCPLVICRKRAEAGKYLLERHPEVDIIVSDDGMQHYALERDIEIMLFDNRGAGNQWLLPAGPLREPVSRKGDFTIINGVNYPSPGNPIYVPEIYRMRLASGKAEQLANRKCRIPLKTINGRIVAAAGIGNPDRFFSMLRSAGLLFDEMPLPDHFDFSSNPFIHVKADIILITEKDAVKCGQIPELRGDTRLWVVPVRAVFDSDELEQRIVERCRGCKIA